MNKPFVIVSFFTGEGDYQKFATQLEQSCAKFSIPTFIEQVPSQGHWVKNNSMKPNFILRQLLKYRTKIIWLDADCEIISYPKLFEEYFDFSIYRWTFDKNSKPINPIPNTDHPNSAEISHTIFSGGVIGFNYTVKGLELLIRWTTACNNNPLIRDDNVLDDIFNEYNKDIKSTNLWLPQSYNRMEKHWPTITPVIQHHWGDGRIFTGEQKLIKK